MDILLCYNFKKKGDIMTYLEKWFDFNRRQKEIEGLLEETIAQQSEQSLTPIEVKPFFQVGHSISFLFRVIR